ncbi:MAG: cell division protein FtsZ, partial [Christensenellaceae bacterium]|nr:cell division protein FtsZ [Christensenellaceae bacterium]
MAKKTTFVTGAEIFVMGIGGGGSNVVDNMFLSYGSGSDVPRNFWCVNTDGQALIEINDNANKLQIGVKTTGGNGSGGDPETGERAARESEADIRALLKDASMLYITAGMGGGTGTGAAPVIASIARELGVLTLAVVTEPFGFEGVKVAKRAREGIEKLKGIVDALIVVPNEKLKQYVPKSAGLEDAFKTADEILARSVRGVIDVVNTHTRINVDFADIKKLLQDCGTAHIGIGTGKGENKVFDAATEAVKSPLLETDIRNAKGLIVCITGGETVTFDETDKALMML